MAVRCWNCERSSSISGQVTQQLLNDSACEHLANCATMSAGIFSRQSGCEAAGFAYKHTHMQRMHSFPVRFQFLAPKPTGADHHHRMLRHAPHLCVRRPVSSQRLRLRTVFFVRIEPAPQKVYVYALFGAKKMCTKDVRANRCPHFHVAQRHTFTSRRARPQRLAFLLKHHLLFAALLRQSLQS